MQDSGWKYSSRLRDLNAAQLWGVPTPSDFDNLNKEDKIDIIAWYEAKWKIEAINTHDAQKKAEAKAKQNKPKGRR